MRRVLLLLLVVAPVSLAVGCGAGGYGTPVSTDKVLLPKSYRFDPKAVEVKAGTLVTWTNKDNFTHSVKLADGTDHVIHPGESVSIRFTKAGTYTYICTLHPHDMHGEVIVT